MTAPASFFTEFVLNIQPQNGAVGEGMAFIPTRPQIAQHFPATAAAGSGSASPTTSMNAWWPDHLDLSRHLLLENLTLGFAALSTSDFTVQIKSWNFSTPGADAAIDSKLKHRNGRKFTLVFALTSRAF
jgi:hypothetical protein